MGKYVQSTLISDEQVIYEAKLSFWSDLPAILLGFFLLTFYGLGLVIWIILYMQYVSTELAFTNKRVVAKFGFISKKTIELNISKVESLQISQNFLGRIFNFGTIIISGAGNPQAPIPGIANPMEFRRAFMEHQDKVMKNAQ